MGKKEEKVVRVVLDTNVLISSLLFKGELAGMVDLWKRRNILPVISREMFEEFRSVLEYKKFKLTNNEIRFIIEEEVLLFFEIVDTGSGVHRICKDPDDDKFIACALSASAEFVVSGDKDLCDVVSYKKIKIIKPSDLLKMFG